MTAKANDFTKAFENMFSAFPADMSAYNDAYKNAAEFTEKFSKIAFETAEKNMEIGQAWTKDALGKMAVVAKAQKDPADYAKAVSDAAAAQAQAAPEHIAAFAEVAKKAQMDTVELMLAAGREVQAEAVDAVKKATKKAA